MFMNGSPATGVYRRGDMKVAYATAAKMFFRGKYPMSEIMSAKTSTSKYDGNDVVMFNLADDPYELYNVWDQNKSLGEELAAEIVNAANMIRTTYGTNEEN